MDNVLFLVYGLFVVFAIGIYFALSNEKDQLLLESKRRYTEKFPMPVIPDKAKGMNVIFQKEYSLPHHARYNTAVYRLVLDGIFIKCAIYYGESPGKLEFISFTPNIPVDFIESFLRSRKRESGI